ncbi:MAG: hypothetical protein GY804_11675 [Alphaproteobacteria bacterium]|nr:hypothetical protein [Alphaproteobacteria bacterium]
MTATKPITVKRLIEQLQKLDENQIIEMYHEVYSGGGDEETYSTPVIVLMHGSSYLITSETYAYNRPYLAPVFKSE